MAHGRSTPCKFYECEGGCSKGLEGTFNKACQKCKSYSPIFEKKKSYRPPDLRRAKRSDYERQKEKEMMDEMLYGEDVE